MRYCREVPDGPESLPPGQQAVERAHPESGVAVLKEERHAGGQVDEE